MSYKFIFPKQLKQKPQLWKFVCLYHLTSRIFMPKTVNHWQSSFVRKFIFTRIINQPEIRENQAGFKRKRGCIDQIFTFSQTVEHRHTSQHSIIVVFPDHKGTFISVDLEILNRCLSLNGVSKKYISLVQTVY